MEHLSLDPTPAQPTTPTRRVSVVRVGLLIGFIGVVYGSGIYSSRWWFPYFYDTDTPQVQGEQAVKEYPLRQYSFQELMTRAPQASPITIDRELEKTSEYRSFVFLYTSEGKKISGMLTVPTTAPDQEKPVIVMSRGFVHEDNYQIGDGSKFAAREYAKQGIITVAPDYLGFGESDPQPGDPMEARFNKPVHVMDLIASVKQYHLLPVIYKTEVVGRMDTSKLGLWGHSNGGQIMLSILEATGEKYPTVLWAPVTKPFPYSVLFFTDEAYDQGKALRAILANFEADYDIEDFTIGKFIDRLQGPILLHQGTADDAVPQDWSHDFLSLLSGKGKRELVTYEVYPGDNHGLTNNFQTIVQKDVAFWREHMEK